MDRLDDCEGESKEQLFSYEIESLERCFFGLYLQMEYHKTQAQLRKGLPAKSYKRVYRALITAPYTLNGMEMDALDLLEEHVNDVITFFDPVSVV